MYVWNYPTCGLPVILKAPRQDSRQAIPPWLQDVVRFVLTGGNLEVSINGTFGKTLQILRVDDDHSGGVSDQDLEGMLEIQQ